MNGDPEPIPNVIGMQRWLASVRALVEYIKINYTVSGGNYFRKNLTAVLVMM